MHHLLDTIAKAGVLHAHGEELSQVPARACRLTQDTDARSTVIAAQRIRRLDFTPATVWPVLGRLIERLAGAQEVAAEAQP